MQTSIQNPTNEKFQKDLAELETLKQKAKTVKPKSVGSFLFQNLIITIFLLLILFVIGFLFSYYNAKKKYNLETAKFTPQAQIKISDISKLEKCSTRYGLGIDPTGTISKACSEANTKEVCQKIDTYNEADPSSNQPDGIIDCVWKN